MLSFNISYPNLIKFHYFVDPTKTGVLGVKGDPETLSARKRVTSIQKTPPSIRRESPLTPQFWPLLKFITSNVKVSIVSLAPPIIMRHKTIEGEKQFKRPPQQLGQSLWPGNQKQYLFYWGLWTSPYLYATKLIFTLFTHPNIKCPNSFSTYLKALLHPKYTCTGHFTVPDGPAVGSPTGCPHFIPSSKPKI